MPQNVLRIKQLDNRLANQIAAGEVVERPASVVKELLENAIDAGASRIEVDIERGGTRLIRITDNGSGIVKQDLALALERHATSKITSSEDLAAIDTLGFRGEALASIASVSKLCLTSRTNDSDYAWQAIAEGREMNTDIQPAAATVGTRIEVRDLFYNTPARQKFLRAEKTEFAHIDEIFKRHALANFEIAFILKHNHKVVKRISAGSDSKDYQKRIESICGKAFAENALPFCCEHEAIKIQGWVGGVHFHRSESDIQYVFINGRPVKDKMLNHAIRQSYQGLLPAGRMPTYVIFLQINPKKIDVNVHPTKHEVRFDEQRMVHDLLVKSIGDVLSENAGATADAAELSFNQTRFRQSLPDQKAPVQHGDREVTQSFNQSPKNEEQQYGYEKISHRQRANGVGYSQVSYLATENIDAQSSINHRVSLGEGLWVVLFQQSALVVDEKKLLLGHLSRLVKQNRSVLENQSADKSVISKPLLFPQEIAMKFSELEEFSVLNQIQALGFDFQPHAKNAISLKEIPLWLTGYDNSFIFSHFPVWVKFLSECSSVNTIGIANELSKQDCQVGLNDICQSLGDLPESCLDYLMSLQTFSQEDNPAIKNISAKIARSLF